MEGAWSLRERGFWAQPAGFLLAASGLLLTSNVLLLAVFLLRLPATPSLGLDPAAVGTAAMVLDLPGVALFGACLWRLGAAAGGRRRRLLRTSGGLLLAWVGASAFWRFALPAAVGAGVQDVFLDIALAEPDGLPAYAGNVIVWEILGLWSVAAAAFLAAHAGLWLARRGAGEDDWLRSLPATAWVVAAALSLAGTALLSHALLVRIGGGMPSPTAVAGALLKLVVAPNVFVSAYAASLRLSLDVRREAGSPAGTPD